jgi:hypothetical protein
MMQRSGRLPGCAWVGLLLAAAATLLCGCPAGEQKPETPEPPQTTVSRAPAAQPQPETTPAPEPAAQPQPAAPATAEAEAAPPPMAGKAAEKPAEGQPIEKQPPPAEQGEPLVDDPKSLKRLDPVAPVWIDPEHKQVVMLAEACRADYPLEFFATFRDRGYEAVVVTDVRPSVVHAGLLALGAQPGHPVSFEPTFSPAAGTEIAIEVRWRGPDGKRHTAPAQQWIRNIQTKKELDVGWVFAGSGMWKDEETGREHYQADGGDFISVLNLPGAALDLPIRSYSGLESRLFEGFVEHLPPEGTSVTVILTPKLDQSPSGEK